MKKCKKCEVEYSIEDFHKSNKYKDGRLSYCKFCTKKSLEGDFKRVCPYCNMETSYVNKYLLKNAIKNKLRCKFCSSQTRMPRTILENNKDEVINMYINEYKSSIIIGEKFGVKSGAVRQFLKKNKIKIREEYPSRTLRGLDKKFSGENEIMPMKWTAIKRAAMIRNIPFKISKEEAIKLLHEQDYKCTLSGVEINLPKKFNQSNTYNASLDRIDNNLPYIISNVQWVHKHLNWIKWIKNNLEFYEICKMVTIPNINQSNISVYIDSINISIFSRYKYLANKRNINFNLTIDDIINKYNEQKGICKLSGQRLKAPPPNHEYNVTDYNLSIDRIDSSLEYNFNNIQLVTKDINMMKNKFTQSEFINWCSLVYQHMSPRYETTYWN